MPAIPAPKLNVRKIIDQVASKTRRKREVLDLPHIEVLHWGDNSLTSKWPGRIKTQLMKKMPKMPQRTIPPMLRQGAVRRRPPSPTYSLGKSTKPLLEPLLL